MTALKRRDENAPPRKKSRNGKVTLPPVPTKNRQRKLKAAGVFVEANQASKDVESEDDSDPLMVADYVDEIFDHMRLLETKEEMKPDTSYIIEQPYIDDTMRHKLMDWLVDVHNEFRLPPETLFLAVNCFYRFLSCKKVRIKRLQLVGATALFIASKYEGRCLLHQIDPPSGKDFEDVADGAYTVKELLKAERLMLSTLEFNLQWPGPMGFLHHISRADNYDRQIRTLSKYFLEITVMDERFLDWVPSFLSAGSYCLARFMLKKGDWVCLFPLHCW
jgi:hypothetical protein